MNVVIRLDALAAPRTGIGYYAESLTRALLDLPGVQISGLMNGHCLEGEALASALCCPGAEIANPNNGLMSRLRTVARSIPGAYPLRQHFRDRQSSRSALGYDVYHEPNFIPFPFQGQTVLTVHDLSHLRHPEYHPRERVRFLNRYLPKAIERAAAVIADSKFTADEIAEFFPDAREKVFPIHLGVEDSLVPENAQEIRSLLADYGLVYKAYILSVATLEPRKNLVGLVRAYRSLPDAVQAELPLVLVGGAGWKNQELKSLLSDQSGVGRVVLAGRVPRTHLAGLLGGARMFAYPSFYEGFGLPIAEALACGTPVLTTNFGAMAEVGGRAAYLVHPSELCEGLYQALKDMPETITPVRYSWSDTAQATLSVYESVLP